MDENFFELNDALKGVYLPQQTPGNPNNSNPSLMPYNPWEGQGTVMDTGAPRSTPDDAPGGVLSSIIEIAPDVFCLIAPKNKGCQQRQAANQDTGNNNGNRPTTNNQPTWALFIGALIIILLLILIFRK